MAPKAAATPQDTDDLGRWYSSISVASACRTPQSECSQGAKQSPNGFLAARDRITAWCPPVQHGPPLYYGQQRPQRGPRMLGDCLRNHGQLRVLTSVYAPMYVCSRLIAPASKLHALNRHEQLSYPCSWTGLVKTSLQCECAKGGAGHELWDILTT